MEPEGSPPLSQQPTNYHFPDPYQSFPSILSYLLKAQLIIVLSSTRRFAIRFFFLRFPHQNFVCSSPLPIYAICPSQLNIFKVITHNIWIIVAYYHEAPHCTISVLCLLSRLKSRYLSQHPILGHTQPLLFSEDERPNSQQYTATEKTVVLYIF